MALFAFAGLFMATAAQAAPEDIQVYIDDISAQGDVGLDLHTSYVRSGLGTAADYPGAEDSLHQIRFAPEFLLGITKRLEAGH